MFFSSCIYFLCKITCLFFFCISYMCAVDVYIQLTRQGSYLSAARSVSVTREDFPWWANIKTFPFVSRSVWEPPGPLETEEKIRHETERIMFTKALGVICELARFQSNILCICCINSALFMEYYLSLQKQSIYAIPGSSWQTFTFNHSRDKFYKETREIAQM